MIIKIFDTDHVHFLFLYTHCYCSSIQIKCFFVMIRAMPYDYPSDSIYDN